MKVTVDQNLCIGCGLCVSSCEEIFELRDGKSFVINNEGCDNCDLVEVAESCPVAAIAVSKEE
jgi:ferredoxin